MSETVLADSLLRMPASHEVGRLARGGAAWTFLLIVSRHGMSVAATAVLARLLSPGDYGLVGMVSTLAAFFQVFSDMGLSWATVQRKEISRRQVDNLFWVNTTFGAALWIACILSGPALSRFYGRSELSNLAAVLGAGFLISSLTVQPIALLRRQMRLKVLSLLEMAAHATGVAVGVGLALNGLGYWALVGQSLTVQLSLLCLLFAFSRYRPGPPRGNEETRSLLKFGGYLAGYGAVNYFARNLDNILIGKLWGAEQLGYYSRAYFLMLLPSLLATGTLTGVMVPALSALVHDRERMALAYSKAVSMIAAVGFPAAVGLAVTAPEAVRLVYGARWEPVAPILVWLSVAGVFQPIHNTMGWLFIAAGRVRELFLWGVAATAVLAAGFSFGIRWGAIGVAVAYAVLMTFVLTVPALYFAHRSAGLRLLNTLRLVVPFAYRSGLMGCCALAGGICLGQLGASWPAVLCGKVGIGALVYYLLCRREIHFLVREQRNL